MKEHSEFKIGDILILVFVVVFVLLIVLRPNNSEDKLYENNTKTTTNIIYYCDKKMNIEYLIHKNNGISVRFNSAGKPKKCKLKEKYQYEKNYK